MLLPKLHPTPFPASLQAREKVHYAACIAGMAFANAFLGVCHSMAHKLGATYHVPHGLANAVRACLLQPLACAFYNL